MYQQYGQEKSLKCVCPPWLIRNTHVRTKIRLNGETSDKYIRLFIFEQISHPSGLTGRKQMPDPGNKYS